MTVLLRTSERSVFKECRQRWAWAYLDGLRSTAPPGPALRFGSLYHEALAAYYRPGRRRGPLPATTFARLYQEQTSDFTIRDQNDQWVDALAMGVSMLEAYVERWEGEDIYIVAPEMSFRVNLKDVGGAPFTYIGRFDALGYDLGEKEFFIFEHKTATAIATAHLALDEQAGSYWAFAPQWIRHLLKTGKIPRLPHNMGLNYILYNISRKALPDARPRNDEGQYLNKNGSVSKVQPPPYFHREKVYRSSADRRVMIRRIRQEAWEMRMVREGKLPIYKNPSYGYPDRHCESCPFFAICELHETGSDWRSVAEMSYVKADPYEDYHFDEGR